MKQGPDWYGDGIAETGREMRRMGRRLRTVVISCVKAECYSAA